MSEDTGFSGAGQEVHVFRFMAVAAFVVTIVRAVLMAHVSTRYGAAATQTLFAETPDTVLAWALTGLLVLHLVSLAGLFSFGNWARPLFALSVLLAQFSSLFEERLFGAIPGPVTDLADKISGTGFGWPLLDGALLTFCFFSPAVIRRFRKGEEGFVSALSSRSSEPFP